MDIRLADEASYRRGNANTISGLRRAGLMPSNESSRKRSNDCRGRSSQETTRNRETSARDEERALATMGYSKKGMSRFYPIDNQKGNDTISLRLYSMQKLFFTKRLSLFQIKFLELFCFTSNIKPGFPHL